MNCRIVPRFPPEITDMVIDWLERDKRALTNTSVVCKSWLSRSRVHLFNRVVINASETGRSFLEFLAFLHSSPHLRSYVEILNLYGHRRNYETHSAFPPPLVVLEPAVLGAMLAQLPRLCMLQLHDLSFHGTLALPASPGYKIEHIMMFNVGSHQDTTNDILRILGLFSYISCLQVHSIFQTLDDLDTPMREPHFHIPRQLKISEIKLEDVPNYSYLRALRHTQSVNTLTSIDADLVSMEDVEALADLLQDARSSMDRVAANFSQCFNNNIYAGEDSDEITVLSPRAICETLGTSISSCKELTTLEVTVSLDSYAEDFETHHDAWDCLVGMLRSAPASVRQIGIELSAEDCAAPLQELDFDWQPLRDALNRFSHLEKVTVVNVPGTPWVFSPQETAIIKSSLPELAERGVLQVGYF